MRAPRSIIFVVAELQHHVAGIEQLGVGLGVGDDDGIEIILDVLQRHRPVGRALTSRSSARIFQVIGTSALGLLLGEPGFCLGDGLADLHRPIGGGEVDVAARVVEHLGRGDHEAERSALHHAGIGPDARGEFTFSLSVACVTMSVQSNSLA